MRIRFPRTLAVFAVMSVAAAALLTGSPAVVTQSDTTIDVGKKPENGISIASEGTAPVSVTIPNAENAADAKRLPDGTVVYAGTEGSATAVIPPESGVQMLTMIANKDADTRYVYDVDVPDGGKVELTEGGAVVIDADGNMLLIVPAPWARDAKGVTVPSDFETDGMTLTQVVEHTGGNFTYPVVADPWFARVINMILGCFGLRDLARMGLARAAWVGGRHVIVRLVPWVGWVSCGIGAYAGWNG